MSTDYSKDLELVNTLFSKKPKEPAGKETKSQAPKTEPVRKEPSRRAEGRPLLKKPSDKRSERLQILITPRLLASLKAEAKRSGISVNEAINQILDNFLND